MSETVKISVRNLVEFILREGDIDQRRTAGADKEQMQLGARIHRKIIKREDEIVIDEIKGVLRELKYIEEPVAVHLAQAKCYAYMYASQNHLEEIQIQMTYCQMETEEIKRFLQTFSIEELKTWMEDVIKRYEKWAKFQMEWRKVSICIPRRAEGTCDVCVSNYFKGKETFHTGAYRDRKDDGDGVSGGESSRRRVGR